jgi:hypothetical protein
MEQKTPPHLPVNMLSVVFLVSMIASLGAGATIQYCGDSSKFLAKNLNISIIPENPVDGGTYTTDISFNLSTSAAPINGGTVSFLLKLNGFPIYNDKQLLCDNILCPIHEGPNSFQWGGSVPSGVKGTIQVQEDWKVENGEPLMCFVVSYKL